MASGSSSSSVGFLGEGCLPAFTFPVGSSAYPISVSTLDTSSGRALPPLPDGVYRTVLEFGVGFDLPIPPPLTVTLAEEPQAVTVPDVVGEPLAAAASDLYGQGWIAEIGTTRSAEVPAGDVISQRPPARLSPPGPPTVPLLVSSGVNGSNRATGTPSTVPAADPGSNRVTVPDLTGRSLPVAAAALEAAGLVPVLGDIGLVTFSRGSIDAQSPLPGTTADPGTVVLLYAAPANQPAPPGTSG